MLSKTSTRADTMAGQRQAEGNGKGNTVSYVQKPGEKIRPLIGKGSVEDIVQKVYGFTVTELKELNSYSDRNYFIQVSQKGRHLKTGTEQPHSEGYLVKIYNSKDSMNPTGIDAHHEMMACLRENNIPAQVPIQTLNGDFYSLQVIYSDAEKKCTSREHLVELRTFIPGRIMKEVPYTPNLLFRDGRLIASMTKAFEGFHNNHLRYRGRSSRLWEPTNVPMLTNYTFCLGAEEQNLIEDIVATYNNRVVPQFEHLPKGYVHGDANDRNILVSKNASEDDYHICGILDFTEAEYTFPVIDLAINSAYLMLDSEVVDQLDTPGYILAGYLSIRTLTQVEWDVLVPCVAGRLAQSLTLGAHAFYVHPENKYVLGTSKKGWPVVKKLWSESESNLLSKWKCIANEFQQMQK